MPPDVSVANARARAIAAARAWVGTPWHHEAAVKGAGVDCAHLILEVFVAVELIERFKPKHYNPDFMLHRGEEQFMAQVLAYAREVERPEPGDVILFRQGRVYSHGGIVTQAEPLEIVHAFAPAGCVIEERVSRNAALAERRADAKFFRIEARA